MQEILVPVNWSSLREVLHNMVTIKPPGRCNVYNNKNKFLINIRNWPFHEASHFVKQIPIFIILLLVYLILQKAYTLSSLLSLIYVKLIRFLTTC